MATARPTLTLTSPIEGFTGIVRRTFQAALSIVHGATSSWTVALLNRTNINYGSRVRADSNSIVVACIRWIQRAYTEAPIIIERWVAVREEWQAIRKDALLDLLAYPNSYYGGSTLDKATLADLTLSGTAYWIKVRNDFGEPVQLWWAPESTMEPMPHPTDKTVFIDHYRYSPSGIGPIKLRVQDVVQFRDGMDPRNPRKGLAPIQSLFREIFTDDEAANMTASLLSNMGVPGVIISPKTGTIPAAAANAIKKAYIEKFGGDKKGEPLVTEGDVSVEQFGFSPEQMQMRSLRGIPEERITAVIGVNAAVVGLGAGLATTKVGATLKEYREEAFESTIIPLYREMAAQLTAQLLPDFRDRNSYRLKHDLTGVRVLQEDEDHRTSRVTKIVTSGMVTVAEGRRALGWVALPEHEVYLRSKSLMVVPAGKDPEEQSQMSSDTKREPGRPPSASLGGNGHAQAKEVALT